MAALINIIIFFMIVGYILKNIAKITGTLSQNEPKEEKEVYRAEADDIQEFLEKMEDKKEPVQETPLRHFSPPLRVKPFSGMPGPEKVFTPQGKEISFSLKSQSIKEYKPEPVVFELPKKKGEPPVKVVSPYKQNTPTSPLSVPDLDVSRKITREQMRQGIIYSIILGAPRSKQRHNLFQ